MLASAVRAAWLSVEATSEVTKRIIPKTEIGPGGQHTILDLDRISSISVFISSIVFTTFENSNLSELSENEPV